MKPYYEHAGITIYHGDCREVLPQLDPSETVLVTDPPYGVAHRAGSACNSEGMANRRASWHGMKIQGDGSTATRDAVLEWATERPCLVFGVWKSPRPAGTVAMLVWDKGPAAGGGALNVPWKASWEEIYVLGRGFVGHRGEGVIKGHWAVTWEWAGRVHPHQKPVTLMVELIQKCPPGVILDPFMGSGTTLRAAKDLGRRAIGIEIEERYCEVAARRLSQEVLPLGDVG